jgi:hypothetical protein
MKLMIYLKNNLMKIKMKKIILITLLTAFIMACKENTKSTSIKDLHEIAFKELDSVKYALDQRHLYFTDLIL